MIKLRSALVGFKEWSLICDALGAGAQSLIIRKGGIAEGRGGFQWQAQTFLLFPTHFHEQEEKITWQPSAEVRADLDRPQKIVIRFRARLSASWEVRNWAAAQALRPFHFWKEEVVRERFGYGAGQGISVALVRIDRLHRPLELDPQPSFGGCRSWVDLPELPLPPASPVLTDAEHEKRAGELERALGSAGSAAMPS